MSVPNSIICSKTPLLVPRLKDATNPSGLHLSYTINFCKWCSNECYR